LFCHPKKNYFPSRPSFSDTTCPFLLDPLTQLIAHTLSTVGNCKSLWKGECMAWRKWQDWVTLIAGAWLIVSPWLLGLTINATVQWTFVVLGAAIAVVALFALTNPKAPGVEWLAVVFGVLTFTAPWLFSFAGLANARWNAWLVGAVVSVMALWSFITAQNDQGRRVAG
jgi:SPW repeat